MQCASYLDVIRVCEVSTGGRMEQMICSETKLLKNSNQVEITEHRCDQYVSQHSARNVLIFFWAQVESLGLFMDQKMGV